MSQLNRDRTTSEPVKSLSTSEPISTFGEYILSVAETAMEAAQGLTPSSSSVLQLLMGESLGLESPAEGVVAVLRSLQAQQGPAPSATALFNAFVYPNHPQFLSNSLYRRYAPHFEVLAYPCQTISGRGLRPGDILLRVARGERWGHVAVVASPDLYRHDRLGNVGLRGEGYPRLRPGLYVQVVEVGPRRLSRADRFARRVCDGTGSVLSDTLLLRPLPPGGLPQEIETEQTASWLLPDSAETLEESISVDDVASEMNGLRCRFLSDYRGTRADGSARGFSAGALLPIEDWNGTGVEATVAGFSVPKLLLEPAPESVSGMRRYDVGLDAQRAAVARNTRELAQWVAREGEYRRNHGTWEREKARLESLLVRRQATYARIWVRQMMYNRFDFDIALWVRHYNSQLSPATALDANIVKSMLYQESRMGTSGAHLMPPPSDWSSSDRHPIRSRYNIGQAIDSWGPQQWLMMREMAAAIFTRHGLSAFERTWFSMSNDDYAAHPPFIQALREFFGFRDSSNRNLMGTPARDLHEDYGFWIRTAIRWLFVKYANLRSPTWAEAVRAYNGGGARARAYRDAVMARVGSSAPYTAESLGSAGNVADEEDIPLLRPLPPGDLSRETEAEWTEFVGCPLAEDIGLVEQHAPPPAGAAPARPDSSLAGRFVAAHPSRYCTPGQAGSQTCRTLAAPRPIGRVVIHTLAVPSTARRSGVEAVVAGWQNPGRQASAHYLVDRDGTITQMVREADVAFHTPGNNRDSIGIEHADVCNDPSPLTTQLYERSAALVRDLANRHGFTINNNTVAGHSQVNPNHGDPGPYWDWEYYFLLLAWAGVSAADRPIRLLTSAAGQAAASASWQVQRRRAIANDHCASGRDPWGATYWRAQPSATGTAAELSLVVDEACTYKVSLWWPNVSGANPAVLVDIEVGCLSSPCSGASTQTVTVDQRPNAGRWNDVAVITVTQTPAEVKIRWRRNSAQRGWILVDGVRLLKIATCPGGVSRSGTGETLPGASQIVPFSGRFVPSEYDVESAFSQGYPLGEAETVNFGGPNLVRWLQSSLNKIIGLQLKVDGINGPLTRQAVRRFQAGNGLVADGIAGPLTVSAVQTALARLGSPGTPVPATPPTISPPAIAPQAACAGLRCPQAVDRFEFGRAEIAPIHEPQILRIAACVVASRNSVVPIRNIDLVGYTDEVGSETANLQLGQRRAEALRDALLRAINWLRPGTSSDMRITLSSQGERAQRSDPALSRRVEVFMATPLTDDEWHRLELWQARGEVVIEALTDDPDRNALVVAEAIFCDRNLLRLVTGSGDDPLLCVIPEVTRADPRVQQLVPFVTERGPIVNWARVADDQRMLRVMELLVNDHGFSVNAAAGLVGNLWAESGVMPNRIEESAMATPMRAPNFAGAATDFTADQVMNRNRARREGPRAPGIGLAQWTSANRRTGLFQHTFRGRPAGARILFDMDTQVDYLAIELATRFTGVNGVLRRSGVSLDDASDEVVYRFEAPGAILDADGHPLPRTNPAVLAVFRRRRESSRRALRVYRERHPEAGEGGGQGFEAPRAGVDRLVAAARLGEWTESFLVGEEVDSAAGGFVRWLQDALNRVLGLSLAVDGIAGPQTRQAIRQFQARQGLTVDGIAGQRTQAALRQALQQLDAVTPPPGGTPAPTAGAGGKSLVACAGLRSPEIIDRFGFGSADVLPTHQPQIIRIARCIVASLGTAHPVNNLDVVGHADPVGTEAANLDLGRRRAEAVKRELLRTIDRIRPGTAARIVINASSHGESRPVPAADPALSRRVEVFMTLPPRPAPPVPPRPPIKPPIPVPPSPPTVPDNVRELLRRVGEALESILQWVPDAVRDTFCPGITTPKTLRFLSAAEQAEARTVYGSSLDFSRIIITDGLGCGGRPFTVAFPVGSVWWVALNQGTVASFATRPMSDTLIHELAHAWQSQHHGSDPTAFMRNSIVNQASAAALSAIGVEASAYAYIPGKPFAEYGAEQIAEQVEDSYNGTGSPTPAIPRHIRSVAAGVADPGNVASLTVLTGFERRATAGVIWP